MKAIALLIHEIDAHDMDSVTIRFGEDWQKTINEELASDWADEDYECAEEDGEVTEADKASFLEKRKQHWLSIIKWEADEHHYHGDFQCSEGKGIGDDRGISVTVEDIPQNLEEKK